MSSAKRRLVRSTKEKDASEKKKLKKFIFGGFWLYAKVEQCSKLCAIQNLNGT